MFSSARRDLLVLLLVCAAVVWGRLGAMGLIDPDEPFYAETAVEMADSGDWPAPRIFDRPQFEKPVLFYWASMASFAILGRTELAARVPGALAATLLVLMTWAFGVRIFGRRSGFLAALVLASAVAFAATARFMLTDMLFGLFLCGACFAFWLAVDPDRPRPGMVALALVSSALAVLVKGPLGILVPALAVIAWRRFGRRWPHAPARVWWLGGIAWAAIVAPWYAYMISRFGIEYVRAFFVHENFERLIRAEHSSNNHPWYYPAVLIVGMLPWWSALAVTAWRARRLSSRPPVYVYLGGWILTSLAFFTIAQSKLPTYVLFLFVPVSLLIGSVLDRIIDRGFDGTVERRIASVSGWVQCVALLAVFAFPEQSAFFVVAGATAACLTLAQIAQVRARFRAWVALSVASSVVFFGTALTWSMDAIEAMASMKPVVQAFGDRIPPESRVLCSPQLARGIRYYAHRPVTVVSNRPSPFFTPHPLPVVRGGDSLGAYVGRHGLTVGIFTTREWRRVRPRGCRDEVIRIGDKVVALMSPSPVADSNRTAQRFVSPSSADIIRLRSEDSTGSSSRASEISRHPAP
jgi:4-amino-4-deoxy-L-arabinose transferase-like glycosyltransferase